MRKSVLLHALLALLVASCFAMNVARHAFLGDDGYIAFRFSKNLVEGHGLVYNPGERVEGYTQPVWVLLIAGAMKLGVPPETAAPVFGFLFGALVLVTLLRLSRWHDPAIGAWMWLAPLALALNRSHTAWSTGGLGTMLFAWISLTATVRFVQDWRDPSRGFVSAGLLFAAATITRPEGGIFFAVAGLFLAVQVLGRRRRSFRALVGFALPVVVLVGAHFLWRRWYYGFWLPNTFYVKISGFWWEQSSRYLGWFLRDHALFLALPLLLVLVRRRLPLVQGLFLAQMAAYLAYIVYIGGDRFEYRFLTPILPLLYWLFQEAVRELHARLVGAGWPVLSRGAVVATCVLLVLTTAALPSIRPPPLQPRDFIAPIEAIDGYAKGRAQQGKFLRELVGEGFLTGDELLALRGAGALPYYSEFPVLDLHGLNDVTIAHRPLAERGMIAHEKVATLDYVQRRGVVMCNVHNTLVFDEMPLHLTNPALELPEYFPRPVRVVEVMGKYLAFGTTLTEAEFLRTFRRFRIVR